MRSGIYKILVTGGAGFMGSAFVKFAVKKGYRPIIVDKLTYAGDLKRLEQIKGKYKFYRVCICDEKQIDSILRTEKPQFIINFAAQTHVDRSIIDSRPFIKTNIQGTQVLLDTARKYKIKKIIQISTDEIYGEITNGEFTEDSPLKANSPYAASKAAADLLIKSYIRTYKFPAIIIRPCNNYGPWQYPEKLIPLAILKLLKNQKIPIYGKGKNIREWLYVEDCAEGILRIMEKGKIGEVYNLGSGEEKRNIDTAKMLLDILKKDNDLIEYVKDRPGHDLRYRLNFQKVINEIGWRPKINFKTGLETTVYWCLRHKDWLFNKWKHITSLYK